ncbi:16S rRNA (guanine(966)-N(2))-methyltransferase RsmD [Undibacterium sp.]|jgi:16S rRNA (guanine966-N2)-methyltransferase|uniref:16S rRNA (guanine(966)-N(2))-methyltransferase RsmD n=1 Tax=Undibacterium sp. TaxID=1914977 RepID=UPI002CCE4F02|nr:16S rRNA (guanine(966)-N(2))-methyltransferase RsmD [Undibacterium sp.]HTD03442.1 16S rRNA (guanine(966)-N(2))-methyltransferase RsmD [Undibacterium sp.]
MNAVAKKQQIKQPSRPPHQVRIIGGQWKRTPLAVIAAEGLRPTPDRVRETVFNWLGHLLDGAWSQLTCLDMFAGTGALGFEAASRGMASVTMVEYHTPAFRQLDATKQKLHADQVSLVRADALTVVQGMAARQQRFDLIFLDPPYNLGMLPKILPYCAEILTAKGLLYVEAETSLAADDLDETTAAMLAGWSVIRADQAGSVFFHILQRNN